MKIFSNMTKKQLGYSEGWISVVINTILFVAKLWVGIISGSVAMIADAWHTLSDSFTSVIVIVGFWMSGKPADAQHPYGHGRAEAIAAIIIGTLLGVVGVNFIVDSIQRLINYRAVKFQSLAIYVFAVSVIVKEILAQFSFWAGKKTNSVALKANGWHHRSDAIASALIVIGALLSGYFWWIDGVLGIIVSLLILYAAYDIISKNVSHLLGDEIDPSLEKKVRAAIAELELGVLDLHHFHAHKYGDHTELTFHLRVAPEMQIADAHSIANRIEKKMKEELDIEATCHIEPAKM
ncbi:MAG: cation diffusion facilitator family transporter [Bacteroidota bacterium]|nr:cation diffusion facilitator family transporter [Bacteroidota bacterium]